MSKNAAAIAIVTGYCALMLLTKFRERHVRRIGPAPKAIDEKFAKIKADSVSGDVRFLTVGCVIPNRLGDHHRDITFKIRFIIKTGNYEITSFDAKHKRVLLAPHMYVAAGQHAGLFETAYDYTFVDTATYNVCLKGK